MCGYILWYQNILWCHRSISGISLVKWFSKLMVSFSMRNLICSIRIYWASRHHCYHFCWPTGKVPSVSTPLQRWRGSWVLDGGKSKFWKNENNPKNQNFEKMKKTPGDTIILHKCTKNYNHMLYYSRDMELNGCNCYFSF